jgi:hypothetical protein
MRQIFWACRELLSPARLAHAACNDDGNKTSKSNRPLRTPD